MEEVSINPNEDAKEAPYELEEMTPHHQTKEGENIGPWVDAYKKLMHMSINIFHSLLSSKSWKMIPDVFVDAEKNVLLFECDRNQSHGFYTLKTQAVLDVRPERLMYVIRDHNPDTRLAWDHQYVTACKELDNFKTSEGEIKVVTSTIDIHVPLIWPRYNLGIAWYGYDTKTRVYKYVFRSTQHRMYKCPKEAVNMIALVGVIVRTLEPLEGRTPQCELIIVAHVNPGNSFPTTITNGICKEWLRDRVRLYEKVAGEGWHKYYGNKKK